MGDIRYVKVYITVDEDNPRNCSEDCRWNYANDYCILWAADTPNMNRCEACLDEEVK